MTPEEALDAINQTIEGKKLTIQNAERGLSRWPEHDLERLRFERSGCELIRDWFKRGLAARNAGGAS